MSNTFLRDGEQQLSELQKQQIKTNLGLTNLVTTDENGNVEVTGRIYSNDFMAETAQVDGMTNFNGDVYFNQEIIANCPAFFNDDISIHGIVDIDGTLSVENVNENTKSVVNVEYLNEKLSAVSGVGQAVENGGEIFNDYTNQALGKYSHAEGFNTEATGDYSHSEGQDTYAEGIVTHAEGYSTQATGDYSHTEGYETETNNIASHAEGFETAANGIAAHTEGYGTSANSDYSHAEGERTKASGIAAHAEGYSTEAFGDDSHTEGYDTFSGIACFEMTKNIELHNSLNNLYWLYLNNSNIDFKPYVDIAYIAYDNKYYSCTYWNKEDTRIMIRTKESIAINSNFDDLERKHLLILNKPTVGDSCIGKAAHAEGYNTHAIEDYSHTSGLGTIAIGKAQTAIGKYNAINTDALFVIGNGESDSARNDAFTVDKDGHVKVSGNLQAEGADFNNTVAFHDDVTMDNALEIRSFATVDEVIEGYEGKSVVNVEYLNNKLADINPSPWTLDEQTGCFSRPINEGNNHYIEWLNPPLDTAYASAVDGEYMNIFGEYRTAERIGGVPVYTCILATGTGVSASNSATKRTFTSDEFRYEPKVIRTQAFAINQSEEFRALPYDEGGNLYWNIHVERNSSNNKKLNVIESSYYNRNIWQVFVQVWYTYDQWNGNLYQW